VVVVDGAKPKIIFMKSFFSTGINSNALSFWLLIARILVGAFMLTHGIPKLQNLMSGHIKFADPFGLGQGPSLVLATFAEFFCSILLMLGLATRLAMIPLIITMLVAGLMISSGQEFSKRELPLLYAIFFFGFLVLGAGRYSIDNLISGKAKRR
jgi:putative oxidoreductase